MYCIPKFYQRNTEFPGTDGLKNENNPRAINIENSLNPAPDKINTGIAAKDYFALLQSNQAKGAGL